MTLFEAYAYLKPPIDLVEHLEYYEALGQLPASIIDYLNRWRAIREQYTFALDTVTIDGEIFKKEVPPTNY